MRLLNHVYNFYSGNRLRSWVISKNIYKIRLLCETTGAQCPTPCFNKKLKKSLDLKINVHWLFFNLEPLSLLCEAPKTRMINGMRSKLSHFKQNKMDVMLMCPYLNPLCFVQTVFTCLIRFWSLLAPRCCWRCNAQPCQVFPIIVVIYSNRSKPTKVEQRKTAKHNKTGLEILKNF